MGARFPFRAGIGQSGEMGGRDVARADSGRCIELLSSAACITERSFESAISYSESILAGLAATMHRLQSRI